MAQTNKDELACVYAALTLLDDDVPITAEKIQTILKAADVKVEPYWPGLFAKALEGIDLKSMIRNIGSGVGAAPAAGVAVPADVAPATTVKEEKKEEKKESDDDITDDEMCFDLFG